MSPSFVDLPEDDDFNSDEEIDISDLKEQHEVRLEEGLDTFVVIDGLPVVPEENRPRLVKFLLRKLVAFGKTKEEAIYMPLDDGNMTEG